MKEDVKRAAVLWAIAILFILFAYWVTADNNGAPEGPGDNFCYANSNNC